MKVARFRSEQYAALLSVYEQLHPAAGQPAAVLAHMLDAARNGNGRCWIISTPHDGIIGYAAAAPVPGLPGLFDLDGGIAPACRRRGYATRLLHHLLQDLHPLPVRQLSHCVNDRTTPAARFLQQQGFTVTHEEWILHHDNLLPANLPPAYVPPAACRIAPLSDRQLAIRTFSTLYTQSFSGTPWYQPYSYGEIDATLQQPHDLLFLWQDDAPIGFAWLHARGQVGEIEPFGVVPEQQSQGYGRYLLTAALHHLARRGAQVARIGAWRSNDAALHIYRQLGFRHKEVLYYLTRTLCST